MNIGERIKTLRIQQNVSTKELADSLDIDLSTLNRIENGKIATFKPEFLQAVAEKLNVGIADLFEEKGPTAIQHNQQGQNINVLYQKDQWEKAEKLYETLLAAKEEVIRLLQEQLLAGRKKES